VRALWIAEVARPVVTLELLDLQVRRRPEGRLAQTQRQHEFSLRGVFRSLNEDSGSRSRKLNRPWLCSLT